MKSRKSKNRSHSFLEWCKDIGGLVKENKTIAIAILVFVVLVGITIVVSTVIGKRAQGADMQVAALVETQSTTEEETTLAVPDELLEEDAYPEVNSVVKKYYQAMADGDIDMLRSIMTGLDEKEEIKIVKKSEYVESYPTVTCYTKKGPVEESYIVYAYYEAKLVDFENLAPGLNALYLCKNDTGAYYINGEEQDDQILAYCEMVSAQDDVVDLVNTVQVKYNEVKSVDTQLSTFLDELPDVLTAAVGEELARREAEAAEAEAATEVAEVEGTENTDLAEATNDGSETVVKTVRTTDVVNVRSSDSQEADKIGKAQLGEEYELLEEKGNGWSKIMFEGQEAFIKTEFLEVASEEVIGGEDSDDDSSSNEDEEEDEEAVSEAIESSPSSGKATVKETVNVRKDASTSADKIAVCYPGDELEVVMKRADGWTEVKYKGKKGFVKSEFLE